MTVQPIQRPEPQDRKRPAKQAERTRARKQKLMDAEGARVWVDGVLYKVNPNDVTGLVERKIRQVLGRSLAEAQAYAQEHPGMDAVGEFLWAVRFASGETDLELDEVLGSISYGSEFEIEEGDGTDSGPKA